MTQIRKCCTPANPRQAAGLVGPIDLALNAGLFKALCDPSRTLIVSCIAKCGRGCSVTEISECCAVDISVVSRHLALLARAGVVEPTRRGRTVRYRVRCGELAAWFRSLAEAFETCCPAGGGAGDGGCC